MGGGVHAAKLPIKTPHNILKLDHDTQNPMPSEFKVEGVFPQCGFLCLHRLVKSALPSHASTTVFGKISKLVAFAKDKWDEPSSADSGINNTPACSLASNRA
jgi:hypothetical protein